MEPLPALPRKAMKSRKSKSVQVTGNFLGAGLHSHCRKLARLAKISGLDSLFRRLIFVWS
jgi:hypothetical protein